MTLGSFLFLAAFEEISKNALSRTRFRDCFLTPFPPASAVSHIMAKEIVGQIKLQIPAGQANPRRRSVPPLGQQGVNIMAFCKEFSAATQKQAGDILAGCHHCL